MFRHWCSYADHVLFSRHPLGVALLRFTSPELPPSSSGILGFNSSCPLLEGGLRLLAPSLSQPGSYHSHRPSRAVATSPVAVVTILKILARFSKMEMTFYRHFVEVYLHGAGHLP